MPLFYSTNNRLARVTLEEAVITGLAPDGGLYMPEDIPQLPRAFIDNMAAMSLHEVAYAVIYYALQGDVPSHALKDIIAQVEAAVMHGIGKAAAAEVDTEAYKILLNKNDVRLLMIALGKDCSCNLTNSEFKNYAIENGRLFVMGFEVVPTEQTPSTVIFGPAKNLVLGFDTMDSHVEYKFIDMRETTGDNMFRVIAISNIGVGVIYPSLFTLSKP